MSQRELFPKATPAMGDVERAALERGYRSIVGVDEAGRGPLAGPVYVAAVILELEEPGEWVEQLDDSKRLTERRREELFDVICERAQAFEIVSADAELIDEINILQATRRAMKQAVEAVAKERVEAIDRVYIDGNQYIDVALPQSAVVKGDGRSYHIAAASILAKVARDRVMVAYGERWPAYGFAQHKGYGTRAHRDAITAHGPCPIHRRTFGGVREHLAQAEEQ